MLSEYKQTRLQPDNTPKNFSIVHGSKLVVKDIDDDEAGLVERMASAGLGIARRDSDSAASALSLDEHRLINLMIVATREATAHGLDLGKLEATKWSGDTTDVSLMDISELRERVSRASADARELLALKPQYSSDPVALAQSRGFLVQLLSSVARQAGCVASFTTPSSGGAAQRDDLQYSPSLAPCVGITDALDIQQLVLSAPDGPWGSFTVAEILSVDDARAAYERNLLDRLDRALEKSGAPARSAGGGAQLLRVEAGSVRVTFRSARYPDLVEAEVLEGLGRLEAAFRAEFGEAFRSLRLHPLAYLLNFDLGELETAAALACRRFDPPADFFTVGPAGLERPYRQPVGWTRIGLRVLGRYDGGDDWLANPGFEGRHQAWYRAYHGTSRRAIRPIATQGLRPSSFGNLGPGVYVTPHVDYADWYGGEHEVLFDDGSTRAFRCVFMCAVRPGAVAREGFPEPDGHAYAGENSEWTVLTAADVRPYGILVKEAE